MNFSKGTPQDGALAVTDAELLDSAVHADLRVSGTFEPPGEANMTIQPQRLSWFWQARPVIHGDLVSVSPTAHLWQLFWLETSTWIVGRELAVTVTYADSAGLQTRSETVPVRADIGWGAYFLSLLVNLAALAFLGYLIWVVIAWLRIQRFPSESVMEMRFPNDEFVRKRALRGSWTINLRAFLVPFAGIPTERAEVAGLQLVSAPGGARLVLPKSSTPAWHVTSRGQTLAQIREYAPSMQHFFLRWGERLEQEDDRKHTLTLVRDRRTSSQGR